MYKIWIDCHANRLHYSFPAALEDRFLDGKDYVRRGGIVMSVSKAELVMERLGGVNIDCRYVVCEGSLYKNDEGAWSLIYDVEVIAQECVSPLAFYRDLRL